MEEVEGRRAWLLLRWLLGAHFVVAGVLSIIVWPQTVAFNALLVGAELAPLATALAVGCGLVGGLSLVTGRHTRFGALCLLAFLAPAAVRHGIAAQEAERLWGLLDGPSNEVATQLRDLATRGQLANLLKNIGLMAVLGFIALRGVNPTGHLSASAAGVDGPESSERFPRRT